VAVVKNASGPAENACVSRRSPHGSLGVRKEDDEKAQVGLAEAP
jgi:hypothetical protein